MQKQIQEKITQLQKKAEDAGVEIRDELKSAVDTALEGVKKSRDKATSTLKQKKEGIRITRIESKLKDFDEKIEALRTRVNTAEIANRIPLVNALAKLHQKQQFAKSKFETLKAARVEMSNDLKSNMDAALKDVETAYNQLVSCLPESQQEYEEAIEVVLTEFEQKIAQLQKEIDHAGRENRTHLNESLQVLQQNHLAARETYKEFRTARAALWREFKFKMDTVLENLECLYDEVASQLH